MKLEPVSGKHSIHLDDAHAVVHGHVKSGRDLEKATDALVERISDLQRVLYADARYALLIVLQGRDASGKDGTVRKVFSTVNPQGCVVWPFGVPSELEKKHDFLWRAHERVPARGMI